MSQSRLWPGFTKNRALTHPKHDDPSLRGRTYAIPFAKVWKASVALASGGLRGWSVLEADEDLGVLKAESKTLLFRLVDDVQVKMSLDENGQTRVDMISASRVGKGDLGMNARRIRKFFKVLDKKIGAGPGSILDPNISILQGAVPVLLLLLGCSQGGEAPAGDPLPDDPDASVERNFRSRSYERHIVFLTGQGDSTLVVPWSFTAETRPTGVDRTLRAWLARSDTWDGFVSERWESPASQVPWQILPRGQARIIVGPGNALERIFFEEGARRLEVSLDELMVEWSGQRAQTFRIHQGAALLASGQVDGFVLDMTRAWTGEDPEPGDWAFFLSGDSLQIVLEDLSAEAGPDGGSFSAWIREDLGDHQVEGVRLPWTQTRAFEPARRDVPMAWEIFTTDGEIAGELVSVNPYLEEGEGEGPMLPVIALYQVSGTVVLDGREFPVHGLIRHSQR